MSTRLPRVISSADFPIAELCSARLNGELFTVGECWYPIDEIDNESLRAASLAPLMPARAILERMTAAWVYGLTAEPRRHHLCVSVTARVHVVPSPRIQLREVALGASDTILFGDVRVTTPLRTVVDLARSTPIPAHEHDRRELTTLLARLLSYAGHRNADSARARCSRPCVPNRTLALARLDDVDAELRRAPDPFTPEPFASDPFASDPFAPEPITQARSDYPSLTR